MTKSRYDYKWPEPWNNTFSVKYKWDKETRYGQFDKFHDDAIKHFEAGKIIVSDDILPELRLVAIKDVTPYQGWDTPDAKAARAWVEAAYAEAEKVHDALPDDGKVHKGHLFSIGVADGSAWYIVTKANKVTCDVEWRGFGCDRYYDHHFGGGGRFQNADVLRYVRMHSGMKTLFSKKS